MDLKKAFGKALRDMRLRNNKTQEDFDLVSSRTYISVLERGIKSPTLDKLDEIAIVLGVHPLSLVVSAYAEREETDIATLWDIVRADLQR